MPWGVGQRDSCPASKPWAVYRQASEGQPEKVVGCHRTRERALAHQRALYANEATPPKEQAMEHLIARAEWKAVPGSPGEIDGYGVFYNNIDLGDDVALPGAAKKTLADRRASGRRFPLIADHELKTTGVVGSVRDAREDDLGVRVRAEWADTQKAQDLRKLVLGGHVNGMSITYEPVRFHFGKKDNRHVRFLDEMKIHEFTITPFPMNLEARVIAAKAAMATADINNLPDSAFAYIESGGKKDSEGKTVPRSLRHFPVHDAAHVRNALARIAQGAEFGAQAKPAVLAAARKLGVQASESSSLDFGIWTGAMRKVLDIGWEPAMKAAVAELMTAGYTIEDDAAGTADGQPTADAAAATGEDPAGGTAEEKTISGPRDGAPDVTPREYADMIARRGLPGDGSSASLDALEAQIRSDMEKLS